MGTHCRLQPFTYANAEGFSREASLKGGGGVGGRGLSALALPSFLWLSASFIQKWRKGCEVAADYAREVARNYTKNGLSLRWDSGTAATVAGWLAFAPWGCAVVRRGRGLARLIVTCTQTDRRGNRGTRSVDKEGK